MHNHLIHRLSWTHQTQQHKTRQITGGLKKQHVKVACGYTPAGTSIQPEREVRSYIFTFILSQVQGGEPFRAPQGLEPQL